MKAFLQKGLALICLLAAGKDHLFATPAGPKKNTWELLSVTVTASNGGVLTCAMPSVTLSASSTDPGVSYSWTGPNSFSSASANPVVSVAGIYTVTATSSAGSGIASITVTANTTVPAGVMATNSGVLTCAVLNVAIAGNSITHGTTYSWAGPNGFTASGAVATAITPGIYTLTATNPANGCISTATTRILQNITAPQDSITATNSGVLTCTDTTVTLTGSSTTPRVSYNWTGPDNFAATSTAVTVNTTGNYTLTVTNPANGCITNVTTTVAQNAEAPAEVTISSPGNIVLTCSNTSVVLTGNSSTSGVSYSWSGPGSSVAGAIDTATVPGNYTLTVTNPVNGCFTLVTAPAIIQNTAIPGAVSASVSTTLSCNNSSVILTGSSTTSGVSYLWTGPSGFISTSRVTTATLGGTYTVTATDPSNGCSFSRSIVARTDTSHPAGVTATNDGPLTCFVTNVTLTGNSTTAGVNYTWTGPNGYFDPEQVSTAATDSGIYLLTVSNPGNGCISIATTTVAQDLSECGLAVARKTVTTSAAGLDAPGAPTGNEGPLTRFTYKVYPNPVSATAFIEFRSPASARVTVEIYNSMGSREKILFNAAAEAGRTYQLTLDAAHLAAGIHYCLIRVNDKLYTGKLLVVPDRP